MQAVNKWSLFFFLLICLAAYLPTARAQITAASQLPGLVFDGDAAHLVCTGGCSSGNAVTQITDQSGLANNASYGAGTIVYESNQINSLPAIWFEPGSSTTSQYFTFGSTINLQAGNTVYVVLKAASNSWTNTFLSGPTDALCYTQNSSSSEQGTSECGVGTIVNGKAAVDTNWHQMNFSWDGFSAQLRLGEAFDGAKAGNITANDTVIGYNASYVHEAFNGYIARILIYNQPHTLLQKQAMEAYLHSVYGL
jgi:hypothetical protein